MSTSQCPQLQNVKICCGICKKTIAKNHRKILCQFCNEYVHINCNQTDIKTYNKNQIDKSPQTCLRCQSSSLPFQNLSDTQFDAENQNITVPPITVTSPKPKCKICTKTIAKNHRKVSCQSCNLLVHIACNQTDVKTYNKIMKENIPQTCLMCQNIHTSSTTQKTPCLVCSKTIAKNHRSICCDSCNLRVHIKCNKTDVKTYNKIIKENQSVTCTKCQLENIPFQNLSDIDFSAVNKGLDTESDILENICVTSSSLKIFFRRNKQN